MTHDETRQFLDCLTYENCHIEFKGNTYWCLGVTHDQAKNECRIGIYRYNDYDGAYLGNEWHFTGHSTDECMNAFLELKYWDGKSFYEAASEMKWI